MTKSKTPEAITAECTALLTAWDNGEGVEVVEVGAVGPAVEQCIHIISIEMLREAVRKNFPRSGILMPVDSFPDAVKLTGYLGANDTQKSRAAHQAYMAWITGPTEQIRLAKKAARRVIMVQRSFPLAPPSEPLDTIQEWTEGVLRDWADLRALIGPGGMGLPPEQVMERLAQISGRMALVLKQYLEALAAFDEADPPEDGT